MRVILFVFLFMLCSCSTIPRVQVEDRIQAWKVTTIENLVKFWGLPTKQQKMSENSIAEWDNKINEPGNSAVSIGGGSYGRHLSLGLGFTFNDLGGEKDYCQRQVTFDDNGNILNIIWKGDQDYCYQITPDYQTVQNNIKQKSNTYK